MFFSFVLLKYTSYLVKQYKKVKHYVTHEVWPFSTEISVSVPTNTRAVQSTLKMTNVNLSVAESTAGLNRVKHPMQTQSEGPLSHYCCGHYINSSL